MEFFEFLANNPFAYYAVVGLFSLLIGSFLNVVILRLPRILDNEWKYECHLYLYPDQEPPETPKLTLNHPRSHCVGCGNSLKWYHNIPVFSWLALKGKCGFCSSKISMRYPLIELLTAVLSVIVAIKFGFTYQALFGIIFTHISIALFFIDLDHQILPDRLVFPLIGLGLLVNSQSLFISPTLAIYGAIIGFMSLWVIYILMKFITGKEGMGYGDFKYLCAIGAWFGPLILHHIFIISAVSGIAYYIISLVIAGRSTSSSAPTQIAFGPHLAIAAWVVLITL